MTIQQIGRLAFREEGEYWNCYYADEATMEGAALLGSIKMVLIQKRSRKEEFMQLMRHVFDDICKELFNELPEWQKPQPAPEKDRSGNA